MMLIYVATQMLQMQTVASVGVWDLRDIGDVRGTNTGQIKTPAEQKAIHFF